MIRWSYAVPRLLLAAVVLLLVYLGLNPLVRWAIVSFAEQVLSTRVEIGRLEASLKDTELKIERLAVADPRDRRRNVVVADQVKLALETGSLLRRQFVVRDGTVRGLKFRGEREAPAEPIDHWQWDFDGDRARKMAERWLDTMALSMRERIEEEIARLESVRLATDLLDRWPSEYQQLDANVRGVKGRIAGLRTLLQTPPRDVAAGIQHYQKTVAELEKLQQELGALGEQFDALPDRVRADRESILAARDRDVRTLQERFEAIRLDEEALTLYLLGPEMGRRVVSIAEWVRWVHAHLPSSGEESPGRLGGLNILFAANRRRPNFLIESLLIDGEAEIAGKTYAFVATAAGLTSDPKLHGRPAVVRAELVGDATLEIHAILDRTGAIPVDRIVLNCPDAKLPKVRLGREDAFSLEAVPGKTHLWIGLSLSRDQVAGSVLMKQTGVEFVPAVAESFGGKRLAVNLATALASIDEIEVQLDLAGPLARPDWLVRSNMGPKLAESFNRLARAEMEHRRSQAAELVEQRVEQELARFQNRFRADEEILQSRLKLSESEIQQLGRLISQRIPATEQIFSKVLGGERIQLRF